MNTKIKETKNATETERKRIMAGTQIKMKINTNKIKQGLKSEAFCIQTLNS